MSLDKINNYLRIDDRLNTSGQPTAAEIGLIADDGCQTLINLITPDSKNAIPNEGEIATELGMTYVHIPVVWAEPKVSDWEQYAALLAASERKTHAHCVVNMRVSAFTFLNRVIHQSVDPAGAKTVMNDIWTPNAVWEEFIDEILRKHDIDYYSI
jgi:uncharacterized protein (TIGR01244 family)